MVIVRSEEGGDLSSKKLEFRRGEFIMRSTL